MSALPVVHRAAYFGDVEEIRRLLSIGYDVNKADNTGNTPMHYAAEYGHEGVITLLHYGADVNHADNYGSTPHGYEGIIVRLHSLGADVNQADTDGTTPIVAAAAFLHDSAVTFLQGLGASIPTDEMELKTVDDVVDFLRLSI